MRALVIVTLFASQAHAQGLPGTADDPAQTLAILPSVVDAPLHQLAVRGATGEDTAVYVDGFVVPRLQHVLGLRSIVPIQMVDSGILATAPDVSVARSSAILLSLQGANQPPQLDANTYDVGLRAQRAAVRMSMLSWPTFDAGYRDGQLRVDSGAGRWSVYLSTLFAQDLAHPDDLRTDHEKRDFGRVTFGTVYSAPSWTGSMALSTLAAHDHLTASGAQHFTHDWWTIDTRGELTRTWTNVAGLPTLEWRIGEQTNMARHDIDIAWPRLPREGSPQPEYTAPEDTTMRADQRLWTPDAALFSSITAALSRDIHVSTGVRVDLFGRHGDTATEPRGELIADLSPVTRFGVAAGAYRRAAEQNEELLADLRPERTTQLTARIEHRHQALTLQGDAYYADRSRLVIRDDEGTLRNTGLGTAYGVELSAKLQIRRLFIWMTGALSRSERQDFLRARERPSELDQPLRATALATYHTGPWRLGGRLKLASGLPTTSIQRAIYDADRDIYTPIFGTTYDDRLPFHYELDVRVDRAIRLAQHARLDVFADLAFSPSVVAYHYSFDYEDRARVRVPIAPYIGVRGVL